MLHKRIHRGKFTRNRRPIFAVNPLLADEELKIRGKIDLIEHFGELLVPVEFKHGHFAPNKSIWYNDIIGLAAYTLLIEKLGFKVKFGEVYYHSSRTRARTAITRAHKAKVKEVIKEIRELDETTLPPKKRNPKMCKRCADRYFCKGV